jgi:hypothetical protein
MICYETVEMKSKFYLNETDKIKQNSFVSILKYFIQLRVESIEYSTFLEFCSHRKGTELEMYT